MNRSQPGLFTGADMSHMTDRDVMNLVACFRQTNKTSVDKGAWFTTLMIMFERRQLQDFPVVKFEYDLMSLAAAGTTGEDDTPCICINPSLNPPIELMTLLGIMEWTAFEKSQFVILHEYRHLAQIRNKWMEIMLVTGRRSFIKWMGKDYIDEQIVSAEKHAEKPWELDANAYAIASVLHYKTHNAPLNAMTWCPPAKPIDTAAKQPYADSTA